MPITDGIILVTIHGSSQVKSEPYPDTMCIENWYCAPGYVWRVEDGRHQNGRMER